MRVTSRSTTASGPPERASSTPASTSAARTVPRGRGPRRGDPSPGRIAIAATNYSGRRPHSVAIVDIVHIYLQPIYGDRPMATTIIHPTTDAQDRRVTARDWFASGVRRLYDSEKHLQVFEKVVAPQPVSAETRWLTMLPGYPDGSYGYAQVDQHLGSTASPRLYIEY